MILRKIGVGRKLNRLASKIYWKPDLQETVLPF
jgi:hypothetical protein